MTSDVNSARDDRRLAGLGPIAIRGRTRRPDDDHDPGRRRLARRGSRCDGRDEGHAGEDRQDAGDQPDPGGPWRSSMRDGAFLPLEFRRVRGECLGHHSAPSSSGAYQPICGAFVHPRQAGRLATRRPYSVDARTRRFVHSSARSRSGTWRCRPRRYHPLHAQSPRAGDQSVPAPAREQPGRLVPVGSRCAGPGQDPRSADLPVDRLCRVPLVPRHGARVVRGRAYGRSTEQPLRVGQGGSRGTAGPRPGLHGGGPGHDRQRRLADERVPDARRSPVLWRHVLPRRATSWDAVLPAGAGRRGPGLAGTARPGRGGGFATRERPRQAAAAGGGSRGRTRRRRGCWTRPRPGSPPRSMPRTAAGEGRRSSRSR